MDAEKIHGSILAQRAELIVYNDSEAAQLSVRLSVCRVCLCVCLSVC